MHSTWYVNEEQVFALCEKISNMIRACEAQSCTSCEYEYIYNIYTSDQAQ